MEPYKEKTFFKPEWGHTKRGLAVIVEGVVHNSRGSFLLETSFLRYSVQLFWYPEEIGQFCDSILNHMYIYTIFVPLLYNIAIV